MLLCFCSSFLKLLVCFSGVVAGFVWLEVMALGQQWFLILVLVNCELCESVSCTLVAALCVWRGVFKMCFSVPDFFSYSFFAWQIPV